MVVFLLDIFCRRLASRWGNAVHRGNLACRDNLGKTPAPHPRRQWDQEQQDDQRGPLGLLEPPIESEERHDGIRACKEDEKLGEGIATQIGEQEQPGRR